MNLRLPTLCKSLVIGSAIAWTAAQGQAATAVLQPDPPVRWRGKSDIAAGFGEKGPWRQNESRFNYLDDPTVAIDGQGRIAVAWVDQGKKDVMFQSLSEDGQAQLVAPVNVSRSPATFSWQPRLLLSPADPNRVYILWQEIIFAGGSHGGDILFARSDDGGRHFSNPLNLSGSNGGDGKGRISPEIWSNGSLDLAVGTDGSLIAAWTEYDGPLWVSRSGDGGKTFSKPARIAGDKAKPARAPSLATGRGQTVYLAWTTGEDDTADIQLARSDDGGASFTAPGIVAPTRRYSDAPRIAVGPDGVLHLVHAESAGGPFDRFHIRYLRSTTAGQHFEAPRDVSGPPAHGVVSAAFPALALDGSGNPFVLWELFSDPKQQSHGLGFAVSTDGGRTFSPPAAVPYSADVHGGTNGSHQGLLTKKLAVSRAGRIAIVNSSLRHGVESRVWLMRGHFAR